MSGLCFTCVQDPGYCILSLTHPSGSQFVPVGARLSGLAKEVM